MADIKLTEEIKRVLSSSRIEGCNLYLPQALPRNLYLEVNKAIVLLGGRWVGGKVKAHVFPSDPRAKFGAALESEKIVDMKKKLQAFFTPQELARRVVHKANVEGRVVLEPSAGRGALVNACIEAGAVDVHCFEIDPDNCMALAAIDCDSLCADFLQIDPDPEYERIVMNPPFTRNQDIKHVAHALKFLKPGGRLVAIMSPNTSRDGFKELVNAGVSDVFEIDAGAFKESGTNIATVMVVIDKE